MPRLLHEDTLTRLLAHQVKKLSRPCHVGRLLVRKIRSWHTFGILAGGDVGE